MPSPATKLSKLTSAWRRGDRLGALRIAARFPRLGDAEGPVLRATAFLLSPRVYEQMGYHREAVLLSAYDALQKRYHLPDGFMDA
jgi:hypothetical protein